MKTSPDIKRRRIHITLNQLFCDYAQTEFSKRRLLTMDMADGNLAILNECLEELQKEQFILILRPIEKADGEDICVKMLRYITSRSK